MTLILYLQKVQNSKDPFELRGDGGKVEGSRVKLAENRVILG